MGRPGRSDGAGSASARGRPGPGMTRPHRVRFKLSASGYPGLGLAEGGLCPAPGSLFGLSIRLPGDRDANSA